MSSKISTIYDAMVTRLGTIFPNHFRLPSVQYAELNPESFLVQGWCFRIGSGENAKRELSCQMAIDRTIYVTLTREFKALELDPAPKAAVEKTLLEDQYTLINDFEKTFTLNDPSVAACEFVSDNGIEIVFYKEKDRFIKIESSFRIRYFESLL